MRKDKKEEKTIKDDSMPQRRGAFHVLLRLFLFDEKVFVSRFLFVATVVSWIAILSFHIWPILEELREFTIVLFTSLISLILVSDLLFTAKRFNFFPIYKKKSLYFETKINILLTFPAVILACFAFIFASLALDGYPQFFGVVTGFLLLFVGLLILLSSLAVSYIIIPVLPGDLLSFAVTNLENTFNTSTERDKRDVAVSRFKAALAISMAKNAYMRSFKVFPAVPASISNKIACLDQLSSWVLTETNTDKISEVIPVLKNPPLSSRDNQYEQEDKYTRFQEIDLMLEYFSELEDFVAKKTLENVSSISYQETDIQPMPHSIETILSKGIATTSILFYYIYQFFIFT